MEDFLEVHIGTPSPAEWARRDRQSATRPRVLGRSRPPVTDEDIDWTRLGLIPRWADDDASSAVAALEVSNTALDWERFQGGATVRNDAALYVSTSWRARRTSSGPSHTEIPVLPFLDDAFYIRAEPIRLARPPQLAQNLTATDRDLALRVRHLNAQWTGLTITNPNRADALPHSTWTPLLITPDGLTVAGVWLDHAPWDIPIYHYVLPSLPSYEPILRWIVSRAVPDLAPVAGVRARRYVADQPDLQSTRERELSEQLASLTARNEKQLGELRRELAHERDTVSAVRDPLLFGTGTALEDAVLRVLTDAGVVARRLDPEVGTRSGDILAEYDGLRVLVEVKSAGGNAPEALVEAPLRHQRTWPQLRPDEPLDGVVLVVNHQHKLPPKERTPEVYQRREFVASLDIPVISATGLFSCWSRGEVGRIRELFGLEPSRDRA